MPARRHTSSPAPGAADDAHREWAEGKERSPRVDQAPALILIRQATRIVERLAQVAAALASEMPATAHHVLTWGECRAANAGTRAEQRSCVASRGVFRNGGSTDGDSASAKTIPISDIASASTSIFKSGGPANRPRRGLRRAGVSPISDKKIAVSVPLGRHALDEVDRLSGFAGDSMRPAGFEPATRGLEVRRSVYENAD